MHEAPGMVDPRLRVRGVVGVLGEGVLRRDQRGYLQQQTVLAQTQVERVGALREVELLGREESFARGSGSEIQDAGQAVRIAQSALHAGAPSLEERVRAGARTRCPQ